MEHVLMAAVAAEGSGGSKAVAHSIDGKVIPADMDVERVRKLSDAMTEIAETARKAEKVINDRRGSIADAMLSIARECSGLEEFNVAYSITIVRYKARHRVKAAPKVYTQTASDIRRMFVQRIDLNQKVEGSDQLVSYSQLKGKASKQQAAEVRRVREEVEKLKPEYLKEFETMVSVIQNFAINRTSETYYPDGHERTKIFETINQFLHDTLEAWSEEHPVVETDQDEAAGEQAAA